jgi:hypothetical protein
MDRAYHERLQVDPARPQYSLEAPIAPVSRIGQTIPEEDRLHGGSMLQGVQAAIRGGAGAIQLVLTIPHTSPFGGRPHAYGKEFRQAIKETIMANETMFAGVEMPTSSLTNVSGFDNRTGLNEATRQEHVQEIKNAIEFVADIGQGGGVDAVAFEFPRPKIGWMATRSWNPEVEEKGPDGKPRKRPLFVDHDYDAESKSENIWLVNPETGRINQIPVGEGLEVARDPQTGEPTKDGIPVRWTWEDLMRRSKAEEKHPGQIVTEDILARKTALQEREISRAKIRMEDTRERLNEQKALLEAIPTIRENTQHDIETSTKVLEKIKGRLSETQDEGERIQLEMARNQFQEKVDDAKRTLKKIERQQQVLPDQLKVMEDNLKKESSAIPELQADLNNQKDELGKLQPFEDVAKQRTWQSYAEAGIYAMGESAKRNLKQAVFVGPELGWPQFYGGHPDEFIEIVKKAREVMAKRLVDEGIISDPARAKEEAARHIKGTFDTSHMGMWLKHYQPPRKEGERPEAYEKRRNDEFRKWYLEETEKIAKAGVVGNIQLVDSRRGEHGHLPPGEGDLPIREAAKIFKDKGFGGPWISEGHDEERFGLGRIRTSAWRTLDANVAGSYTPGGPSVPRWGDVYNAYLSRSYSPMRMVGAYTPNAEFRMGDAPFKLWSDIPFE